MGMFDIYEPRPALPCATCGHALTGWQSKDGPCALAIWEQGHVAPRGQDCDPRWQATPEFIAALRLPDRFALYTWCDECGASATATGFCRDGLWHETADGDAPYTPRVAATPLGRGWRQCGACADAWHAPDRPPLAVCPYCGALTELSEA